MGRNNAAKLIVLLTLVMGASNVGVSAQASKPAKPGTPRPVKNGMPPGPLLFHGYPCSGDCTSHQEGYAWGSAHKIANPMDCRGTSETFIEGCRAFAGIEGPLGEREIFQDED